MSASQRGRSSNEVSLWVNIANEVKSSTQMDGGSESKRARYEMVSHQETKVSITAALLLILSDNAGGGSIGAT